MRLPRLSCALLSLALAGLLQAADRPNIVWINCEDLDPTIGAYGHPQAITPNLNALAEESIVFRNAFANAPICAPARSCLITGMYPVTLGSQHLRCEIELPEEVQPFPNLLKEEGYFVTNWAKTDYNFSPDGIYDYWKKDWAPWRQREGEEPFFSFFVFGSTHEGPGNFRERYEQVTENLSPEKIHDPADVTVPPYYPDTPGMRDLLARYHDLVSAMDEEAGQVIDGLKEDGLWEDTIVWFFSDHGHGLPRHKRWLLDSGLRVPFMVRIPEKYEHLAGDLTSGEKTDQMVSFVDFAPTVLSLAGAEIPEVLQGRPFLGEEIAEARELIFGTRDRADDMYELSRAVHDGRYIYVRHFFPHLPWMQGGRIFGNQKESLAELRRARHAGEMTKLAEQIFAPGKPVVELYDLQNDPHEVNNLADDPAHLQRLLSMGKALSEWMLEVRDTAFLNEAEYHRRAEEAGLTVYDWAQNPELYDLPEILAAAEKVSVGAESDELIEMLQRPDSGVRYWGSIGALIRESRELEQGLGLAEALQAVLDDPSPSVAISAAEALCVMGHAEEGLPILTAMIRHEEARVVMQASRALFQIGEAAEPVAAEIASVRQSMQADPDSTEAGRRKYRDFNYTSFAAWSLEWALINVGAAVETDFE